MTIPVPITPEIAEKIYENVNKAIDCREALGRLVGAENCETAVEELHRALDKYLNRAANLLHDGREQ